MPESTNHVSGENGIRKMKEPWEISQVEYVKQFPGDLAVRIGGSGRLLEKQGRAFAAAGIPLRDCGQAHGHWSNRHAVMPDTSAAREMLKKMGGRIAREQPDYLSASYTHRLLVKAAIREGKPVPAEVMAEYETKQVAMF